MLGAQNPKGFTPRRGALSVGQGGTPRGALDVNSVNFRIKLRAWVPSRSPGGVDFNFTESQGAGGEVLGGWAGS